MRRSYNNLVTIFFFGLLSVLLGDFSLQAEPAVDTLKERLKEQVKGPNPFEGREKKIGLSTKIDEDMVVDKKAESDKNDSSEKQPQEEKKLEEERNIFLNFENTDLSSFINYMAELKQINLIPDKTLEGVKISLTVRTPLTVTGAWRIFTTVLEMSNFSIVKVGDLYEIIPKDQAMAKPLPAFINVPVETLPESDERIRYVIFLDNIGVKSVESLLTSLLSAEGKHFPYEDSNGFVITDKAYNVRSAVKLLQELDTTGQTETVVVMKLKNVNAVDVRDLLEGLIGKSDQNPLAKLLGKSADSSGKYFPQGTKIIAEERTNSLILLGLNDVIKKIEDFIINNVDTELKATESPLHIYELQYTDAKQIADILKEVVNNSESKAGESAKKYGAIRGGVKYFRSMNFGVDKDGNRLIVSSTDKEDWELLKKTIKDLDKPQPQVGIETLLISVNATDLRQLGGSVRNKKGKLGNVNFQSAPFSGALKLENPSSPISLLGNMLGQIVSSAGSTVLSFGKNTDIWGVFEAIKQVTNATILSQPFVTAGNKTKAVMDFGEDRQVEQEAGSGQTGYVTLSAKTKVEVTPLINLDGIIRMSIDIKNDTFTGTSGGNKNEQTLKTDVTIADGQVLVLGGFIQTDVQVTKSKTPLLGDIPGLGWLFKNEKKVVTEDYLFILMAPTIIKPRTLPGMGLYTRMKMHQATEQIESGMVSSRTKDPVFNWFFNPEKDNYTHKVLDYANARYQPTTVDIKNDPYYRTHTERGKLKDKQRTLQQEQTKQDVKPQERKSRIMAKEDTRGTFIPTELQHESVVSAASVGASVDTSSEKKIEQSKEFVKPVAAMVKQDGEKKIDSEVLKKPEPEAVVAGEGTDRILKRLKERRQQVMQVDRSGEPRKTQVKQALESVTKPQDSEPQVAMADATIQLAPVASLAVPTVQREKFKDMLDVVEQESIKKPIELEKRNRLKDFLARGEGYNAAPLDLERRNKLKQFLSRGQDETGQHQQQARNTV